MIVRLLVACRPDFIQYDSKGHPGYLSFPSKTGMAAPGIVQDSLAIWRRITAREGVGLYNHFSSVLDGLAVSKHPDWARIGPDGKKDPQETSLFSSYEDQLMIPELEEAAVEYDLDGSWVDGDCWAVKPDYSENAIRRFHALTGYSTPPKTSADPGWREFLDVQREQFRAHVRRYVSALHEAKPGFQITSNWMYSTFLPERPTIPLDFLSGDIAFEGAVSHARLQSRYLASVGKPWELMSWGFNAGKNSGQMSHKPVPALQQESAIVLAQGGSYEIYYQPSRAGWIDDRIIHTAAQVSAFCRGRQRWCQKSETVPEAGVLYSSQTLYRTADRVFGPWGAAESPATGALNLFISCGYSVDIIPDWRIRDIVHRYPLVIVPDWKDTGQEMLAVLANYVKNGGKLVLYGAENTQLFARKFALNLVGYPAPKSYLIADETGFAEIQGAWQHLHAERGQIVQSAYRTEDTRKDALPFAVRLKYGKGAAIVCPAPLPSAYAAAPSTIMVSLARRAVFELYQPLAAVNGRATGFETVLRRKNRELLVHLLNTNSCPVMEDNGNSGFLPRTGNLSVRVRMPETPRRVFLEPGGIELQGHFEAGEWAGTVPAFEIHATIRFAGS